MPSVVTRFIMADGPRLGASAFPQIRELYQQYQE